MSFAAEQLHVISVISNPVRYESRGRLARQYLKHAQEQLGVTQWLIEAVYGDREPEVADRNNPHHLIVKCDDELWIKESLINRAVQLLPYDWKYVAWVDADVQFIRPNWAVEVIHALQHHAVVQCWSHGIDLGPNQEMIGHATSFMCRYRQGHKLNNRYVGAFHPGYAWAWRREAWDLMGGMIELAICGAGDRHMACALVAQPDLSIPKGVHPNYNAMVNTWAAKAARFIRGNVGLVEGTLLHHFHGWKADRGYHDRWQILVNNQYDPHIDVRKNWQGILHLSDNKPRLRDDLRRYFRARNEDAR